jgi:hypothetical protein
MTDLPWVMNPTGYFSFEAGFIRLKKLWNASPRPASRVCLMRYFYSVVLPTLVLLLVGGSTLSAFALVSHSQASHRRAHPSRAVASSHRPSAHRRAVATSRSYRRRHGAALIAAHRHAAPVAPQKEEVAAIIPPAPMKRWEILPPLVGSRASLIRQNERTEADGLQRIEDDAQLNELRREKALVAVPVSAQLRVNEGLPINRRYCRPWTAKFLVDLAQAHARRFHRSLQVNSAVRTVDYQRYLMSINGNAAPADGDIASPHLTGATIDIAKKGLSTSEVSWMRAYLLPLEQAGKIDVEEEFYQSCFHITVYKAYAPASRPGVPRGRVSSTLLAAGVR